MYFFQISKSDEVRNITISKSLIADVLGNLFSDFYNAYGALIWLDGTIFALAAFLLGFPPTQKMKMLTNITGPSISSLPKLARAFALQLFH